jgi:GDP-L-fucose synthase
MVSSQHPMKSVYVAGHRGMVGRAVIRAMEAESFGRLITRNHTELDICDQAAVSKFFAEEKPNIVVFAAAKVGGIYANETYPAQFLYDNLMMAANTIHAAHLNNTSRFLFLGSTCVYPRRATQPMHEDCLLSGPLESTNEAYALAKISGLKLCQFYRSQYGRLFHSAMPTNLYGAGDNYHLENSHVLPALIRRFHEATVAGHKHVSIWGSGQPRRDFLHVDDLAAAILHLLAMGNPPDLVNVGTGSDVTIMELAQTIAKIVGFEGEIKVDLGKPDGTPIKRTDTRRLASTGWSPKIDLQTGLKMTYQDFLKETQQGVLREA